MGHPVQAEELRVPGRGGGGGVATGADADALRAVLSQQDGVHGGTVQRDARIAIICSSLSYRSSSVY